MALTKFSEWYEEYLNEANVQGLGSERWWGGIPGLRDPQDLWAKFSGGEYRKGQRMKERENFLKRDDPTEQKKKQDTLYANLKKSFFDAAGPNAEIDTRDAIDQAAEAIAKAYTHGGTLGPTHLEGMLMAVHQDPKIPLDIKKQYWDNHVSIYQLLIDPTIEASPETWYIPNDAENQYNPNLNVKETEITARAKWFDKSPHNSTKAAPTKQQEDVWQLVQRYAKKGQYEEDDLVKLALDLRDDITNRGNEPIIRPDISLLLKSWRKTP